MTIMVKFETLLVLLAVFMLIYIAKHGRALRSHPNGIVNGAASSVISSRKVGCARVEKWAGLSRAGQLSPSQTAKPVSQRPQ